MEQEIADRQQPGSRRPTAATWTPPAMKRVAYTLAELPPADDEHLRLRITDTVG